MGMQDTLREVVAGILIERPAKGKGYAQWISDLEASGQAIDHRALGAKNQVGAAKVLRHITGIERWCQIRLQVFLGAPFVRDEYDNFQPGTDLTTDQQRSTFLETRQETIALTQTLAKAEIPDTVTVLHNALGPLTVRGWLRYIEMHASLESKKMR